MINSTGYEILNESNTRYPKPVIETLTFDDIVDRLRQAEQTLGKSSVELFSTYLSSDSDITGQQELEDWFDLFFLFLGTEEVKRFLTIGV